MTDYKNYSNKKIIFFLIYISIFFFTFFLYHKTLSYDISGIDDDTFITMTFSNISIIDIFTNTFFLNNLSSYFRPILSLSVMLDNLISNSSPYAFHTTNVMLHIIASMLLFFFLKRYYFDFLISFLAALVFAAHPINIFSVAWIPGRNDLLLFIFLLSSVIFLLEYLKTQKKYLLLIHYILFIMSLFTKEIALIITLVYVCIIIHKKLSRIKTLKFILLWSLVSLLFLLLHMHISSKEFTIIHYLNNLFASYKVFFDYYCGAYFLKIHFSGYVTDSSFYLGILAFCISLLFAIFCKLTIYEKILYFTLPIIIISVNLLAGQLFYQASRMYIPLACILIPFCSFLQQIKNKKIICVIFAVIISISFFLTIKQSKYFENPLTFLQKVDSEKPNYNTVFANLYSYHLLKNGNTHKAAEKIKEIAEITGYKNAYNLYLLAVINIYEGKYQQAINILEPIINFDKKDILIKLFICYKYVGNADKSAYYYNQAVEFTGNREITDNLISRQEEDLKNVKI